MTSVLTLPEPAVREVTAADVLNRAADLIEEFGWCQYDLGSKERGRMCMLGAFSEAVSDLGGQDDWGYFAKAWGECDRFPEGVARWNDTRGRTREEVVARLREAAAAAGDAS